MSYDNIIFHRADRQARERAGVCAPDMRSVFRRECETQGKHGDLEHADWIDVVIFDDFHDSRRVPSLFETILYTRVSIGKVNNNI